MGDDGLYFVRRHGEEVYSVCTDGGDHYKVCGGDHWIDAINVYVYGPVDAASLRAALGLDDA